MLSGAAGRGQAAALEKAPGSEPVKRGMRPARLLVVCQIFCGRGRRSDLRKVHARAVDLRPERALSFKPISGSTCLWRMAEPR
jgi:hypothetical protein